MLVREANLLQVNCCKGLLLNPLIKGLNIPLVTHDLRKSRNGENFIIKMIIISIRY